MCWFSIAKYLLFAFNFVLWATGAAVLGLGIYLAVSDASTVVDIGGVDFYASGCYILIGAGSFALIIGFMGCCGASKESTCLLGLYFSCLLIIFLLQVGVGIWALVVYDSVDELIEDSLYSYDFSGSADDAYLSSYVSMEQTFECCGKNNSCSDWRREQPNPLGCECSELSDNCVPYTNLTNCQVANTDMYGLVYKQSCDVAMTQFVEENILIIAGIGLGIGLAEIFGMIFSICMCCAIKEKQGYA